MLVRYLEIDTMQLKSFRDYVDLKQGLAINKGTDYLVSNKKENEFKIPLLRIADLISGTFSKFVSEEVNPNVIAGKNDIIYTRTGQIGLAFNGFEGVVHNNSFIVTIKEDKKGELNQDYLFTVLNSDFVRNQAISLAHSSVQPDLTHEMFKNILFPLPNIEEQRRIAKIYNILTRKIDNNKAVCANLESMAKTLYDYWFVQFDFPDDNGHPYKTSGGKMEWNETLSREIPVGWEVSKLSQHISASRGISYSTKMLGEYGIPMVNLASFGPFGTYKESGIKRYVGKYTLDDTINPYELIMCNTQQTAIKYETDIIGHAFLMPDIYEGDVVSSHHMTHIHVDNESLKYYLVRLFNTNYFHRYISGHTNGTNILGLLFSGVEDYTDVIPKQCVLDAFAIRMKSIEQEKSRVIKENNKLISLRDCLIPMLMNGQVTFRQ